MPLTLNVGIDFDHTLVNNNVHNAIIREFEEGTFPGGINNLSDAQSAINSDNMSVDVEKWLDRVISINNIVFFNKKLLHDLLEDFRKLDCQPFILSASSFPGAAKYMLKEIGEIELADNVHSVSTLGAAQNKADYLLELEKNAYREGATSVATVFIDDSKKNITTFMDLTMEDSTERCIVQVGKKGLDDVAYNFVKEFSDEVVRMEREAKRETVSVSNPKIGKAKEEVIQGAEGGVEESIINLKKRKPFEKKIRKPIIGMRYMPADDRTNDSRVSIRKRGNVTHQSSSFEAEFAGSTKWRAMGDSLAAKNKNEPSGNTQNKIVNSDPNVNLNSGIQRKGAIKGAIKR